MASYEQSRYELTGEVPSYCTRELNLSQSDYERDLRADEDPARIPPIRLTVGDLRYGEARLGEAELETWPTPEGLHVERLSTRAEALRLDASGDWTRDRSASQAGCTPSPAR